MEAISAFVYPHSTATEGEHTRRQMRPRKHVCPRRVANRYWLHERLKINLMFSRPVPKYQLRFENQTLVAMKPSVPTAQTYGQEGGVRGM